LWRGATIDEFISTFLRLEKIKILEEKHILGMYVNNEKETGEWPKEFIFLNEMSLPEQIMGTYFHELTHYECKTNGCLCIRSGYGWLIETHALEGELKKGVEADLFKVVETTVYNILFYMVDPSQPVRYRLAAMNVLNKSAWQEATAYIQEKSAQK
jgi:hypothetical protein